MLMNFSLLQKGELVMIRRAIDRDASRIAEISVFSKRMNYREIFHDDMVSFGEIQVYPLAKEYIEHTQRYLRNFMYMKMILLRGSFIFRERKSWNCM